MTTESELHQLFAAYGNVKATKIILDRAGVSKGYGFVTFETEEEARKIQKEADIILKDKKLNIAPAIKKQPFARVYDFSCAVLSKKALHLLEKGHHFSEGLKLGLKLTCRGLS
ncbi:unnamed protein product [Larinioides sclopetarius]|uniref:RRM domain-containing protein n=1 Tax=Larinioides sclopetarius TaxID=280406 RepID=A0AAV2BLB8_9ARAC